MPASVTMTPQKRSRAPTLATVPGGLSQKNSVAAFGPGRSLELESESARQLRDEGEIGAGGSGSVRKAYDPILHRTVAMKVMIPRPRNRVDRRNRFINEARTMAQLDHPNIVPVHDLVADARHAPYFVMKLVRGQTLEAVVGQHSKDSANPEALHRFLLIFLKVCDALAFAHSRGIIHCDLKPSNIMVGEFGEVYLMDWGVARHTTDDPSQSQSGAGAGLRGTPAFMSPEQAHGDLGALDQRTDIFGLGAVLYYILTGRAPFAGKSVTQSITRAKSCSFEDPKTVAGGPLSAALVNIVKTAMAPNPVDRYATVLDLARSIEQFARGEWHLPVKTFSPGSIIVREGDWADAAYIVVKGSCRVLKTMRGERHLLRTLGPGDVFGETGILSGDVRTATVEAVDKVTLRMVTRELFHDQLGVNSWLAKFVLALADRFRDLEQKQAHQQTKNRADRKNRKDRNDQ